MTIEQIQAQIQALTDDEYIDLRVWMGSEERSRREAQPAIEQAQAEVVKELQDAGKLPLPDALTDAEKLPEAASDVPEWRDPGTDHSMMYREGDIVRYKGQVVRSTHKGLNHWEPGTLGFDGRIWEVIENDPEISEATEPGTEAPQPAVEQPAAPAYRQPSGAHDAYKQGDRVTYKGAIYESTINGNVWAPDAYPAGWKKL